MTGFGGGHGDFNGLVISHFAKQDNVGTLTQGGAQGGDIVLGIHIDLTLADDTAVVAVQVFQRIFKCNNMGIPGMVDAVDHTGQSRGFTGAGSTGDQHHTAVGLAKMKYGFRDTKLCRIWQGECDHTDHSRVAAALFVGTDTETGNTGQGKRKVIISLCSQPCKVPVFGQSINFMEQCICMLWQQTIVINLVDQSVFPERDGTSGDDKNIGDLLIYSLF